MQLVPNCNQIFISRLILARFRLGRQALFTFLFSPFTIHFIYWEQSRLRSRPAGVVETGSHKKEESASRMLLGMGKAAPFRKGGFSQALFFPKQNAGVFRPLRRAAQGSALRTRELLKKFDQNFNTGARRMRLWRLVACFCFVCGAQCWEQ